MKILFITHQYPWPANSGQKLRNFFNLKHLSCHHDVDLIVSDTEKRTLCSEIELGKLYHFHYQEPNKLLAPFIQVVKGMSFYQYRFQNEELRTLVESIQGDYDLIWLGGLQHYINLKGIDLKPKVLLDNHNVESELYREYMVSTKNLLTKPLLYLEFQLLQSFERNAWKKVNINTSCSEQNAIEIFDYNQASHYLPNCMDFKRNFSPQLSASKKFKLIYCGTMNWLPNVDAIEYFMDEIWPKLKIDSQIEFHLVGGGLPSQVEDKIKAEENCFYHGRVPDLNPYYESADLSVVPLRMGSGTRLKILEAGSYHLPTVSTSVGAEGLEDFFTHGVYQADSPEEFVHNIFNLKANPKKLKSSKTSIFEHFKNYYSTNANSNRINQIFENKI